MTSRQQAVCVVGAGPRGLSVLERLCAAARGTSRDTRLHIHLVDPHPPGPGRVWRVDQSRQLLMNTVAGQISLFTDDSVELQGPLEPGPSLYQWAQALLAPGGAADCGDPAYRDVTLAEARDLGPDSYPTRAFYGQYLTWVFDRIVAGAPAHVHLTTHAARAVALDDAQARPGHEVPLQRVTLSNGTVLDGLDAVVLALGHLPADAGAGERAIAEQASAHGLGYLPPANPADVDLSAIGAGEPVLLRGLGLNFFDYQALLTAGRGGVFERVAGRLVYRPSGREPRLYAGSRRGIPYQARGENEKGPHGRHEPLLLTPEKIAELHRRPEDSPGVDFRAEVWPLVAKEAETVYYSALLASRDRAADVEGFRKEYLDRPWNSAEESQVLDAYGITGADRWDWDGLAHPYRGQEFDGPGDFERWLLDHLRTDVAQARRGNVSGPHKAALDVLRDLRNEIRLVVDHGGLHGDSHREHLDRWYTPLNAYLSIGPPARRTEEMVALIEAGVLRVIGPDLRVDVSADGYRATSPYVPDSTVRARFLIEARLPDITLRRTGDALLRHLRDSGQCRAHRVATRDGGWYETDGLAVTARPFHLLDAADRPHPRRFAFGVPTEAVHWVTAAGIRPGVGSVTLTDSDAIALAALACGAATAPDPEPARTESAA
ncbi:FAD/NAD(P)-binding protein [Streptomyces buecherae]|uniref:FAD/NAD(P)-binding protein n=1 Tax=Streptomyces buecherae TaxID=2763006 RepID=UPI001C26786B|nr:FAD/NAD(P)-binding protein [Streptomyces buecherae]